MEQLFKNRLRSEVLSFVELDDYIVANLKRALCLKLGEEILKGKPECIAKVDEIKDTSGYIGKLRAEVYVFTRDQLYSLIEDLKSKNK